MVIMTAKVSKSKRIAAALIVLIAVILPRGHSSGRTARTVRDQNE